MWTVTVLRDGHMLRDEENEVGGGSGGQENFPLQLGFRSGGESPERENKVGKLVINTSPDDSSSLFIMLFSVVIAPLSADPAVCRTHVPVYTQDNKSNS